MRCNRYKNNKNNESMIAIKYGSKLELIDAVNLGTLPNMKIDMKNKIIQAESKGSKIVVSTENSEIITLDKENFLKNETINPSYLSKQKFCLLKLNENKFLSINDGNSSVCLWIDFKNE
jgi:hypothetical protein